jgi:hypothetical protein
MKNIAAGLGLLACAVAQADIIDHGWYTEDTGTGLYWLDVTETQGNTYNEVTAQFGAGGRYEGWRYAERSDIETLLPNFGILPQGNPCQYTGNAYCDSWSDGTYTAQIEQFVQYLGDTESPYLAATSYSSTADPAKPNAVYGYLDRTPVVANPGIVPTASIYAGTTGETIFSGGNFQDTGVHSYVARFGSYLIRNTVPTPLPVIPPPAGAIDFETVTPADFDLQFLCDGAGGGEGLTGECDGHFMSKNETGAVMWMGLASDFDRQATPWMRIVGFDYLPIRTDLPGVDSDCSVLDRMYIDDATGRNYIQAAGWAPQGGGWCRAIFTTDWAHLPPLPQDLQVPGVAPVMAIGSEDVPDFSYRRIFYGWALDNLMVESIKENIVIDFDPWNAANEIRPKLSYFITIEIKTTSIAAGDAYDFDATQVDIATLLVGPNGAASAAAPLTRDLDEDGDTDMVFGFRMQDTGLDCLDTSISISGKTLSGEPFGGHDVIVPVGCEEPIEIDVDPWSAANEVRPDDDYVVTVGLFSKSIATGDDADLDVLQIDPASLQFGPGLAPNVAIPLTGDLNGDLLTDVVYGFNMPATGIACNDTEVMIAGETYAGLPVIGSDSITTVECGGASCHP